MSIEAGIDLEEDDVEAIKKAFQKEGARNVTVGSRITYTQNYHFVNSKHVPEKKENVWSHGFSGILGNDRTVKRFDNDMALKVNDLIKARMPKILYFPNFLFEFPGRIYLESTSMRIRPMHSIEQWFKTFWTLSRMIRMWKLT